MLDVSIRIGILNLMLKLKEEREIAFLYVTHDLAAARYVADDILVMYAGRVMERGTADDVFENPQHPYTWGLLQSVTRLDRKRRDRLQPIPGSPPSLIRVPSGCPFHERCAYAELTHGRAETEVPALREASQAGHLTACHLSAEVRAEIFAREVAPAL